MFAAGRWVYRHRYAVVVGFVVLVAFLGLYGRDLGGRLSQEGWFDDSSESVAGSVLADSTFGRDTDGDVIALYTAPGGSTVDDPGVRERALARFDRLRSEYPQQILKIDSYWDSPLTNGFADKSKRHAFASIGLRDQGTKALQNFDAIESQFGVDGLTVQLAGLQPVVNELNDGMQKDIRRAEVIALPLVAILLYFVFGGVIAALLPVFVGGLTIAGSQGIVRFVTQFLQVNAFASAVITLISLGLAVDYGLFTVTRFREELAEGSSVADAVQRTVASAGRTIVFSASIIVVSLGALLIYPYGVLKSVPFGAISSVALAALLSVTVLPALLGILGSRVDMFGYRRLAKSKTNAEIDAGWWARVADFAMRRPLALAVPLTLVLLALIVPFRSIEFGGVGAQYLAPDNAARVAQQDYDRLFPQFRTEPVRLVIVGARGAQLGDIRAEANKAPGLTGRFEPAEETKNDINVLEAGLVDKDDADPTIYRLRSIPLPDGVRMYVAGVPTLERDSIHGLIDRLPLLATILVALSVLLMLMAFGSLVLAIKAVVVSALSLGATLGVLTWIFVDGHGSGLLGFTPGPLMFAVLVLIVTVVFGLSTDYEIFLMSRMVEARRDGASTREAIRFGIAHTGGVITAAASILIVVTGAFGFSNLVLMKYIAFGMIAALILDATIIRMLLVPAIMTLLGDRCWWAPRLPIRGKGPPTH
ncbi:MMPL family transporter [Antrihabitans cavernicola]|uniref:MMPL family transporter n=1 Tax=Antrihabitans cavernicola TaxID=2495913 RepID=A0A5A7SER0_9NOCA|nr:MMPL family transporter [Spelaeibacter cavernicola]KAA0023622.1 MMPL family transporter [Spelaeibacter cavernicola]